MLVSRSEASYKSASWLFDSYCMPSARCLLTGSLKSDQKSAAVSCYFADLLEILTLCRSINALTHSKASPASSLVTLLRGDLQCRFDERLINPPGQLESPSRPLRSLRQSHQRIDATFVRPAAGAKEDVCERSFEVLMDPPAPVSQP